MNWNSASVAIGAVRNGSSTWIRIWKELAPSIRAASSTSRGIDTKNWRIRKTPNAAGKPGQMSALYVSIQSKLIIIKYSGIRKMTPGIIIDDSTTQNQVSRPGKRMRDSGYAVTTASTTLPSAKAVDAKSELQV